MSTNDVKQLSESGLTPEQAAKLFFQGHRDLVVRAIRSSKDPALYVLQAGVTLGILMENPKNAYHQLRTLLSAIPPT